MADKNQTKSFTEKLKEAVTDRLKAIENSSSQDIVETIRDLKEDKNLWNKLGSGNRNYLQKTLDAYGQAPDNAGNYIKGAVKHLVKAAPFQLGHIAQKVKEKSGDNYEGSGEEMYQKILNSEKGASELSEEELFELASEIEEDPEASNLKSYQGTRSAVQSMLEKYQRLKDKDPQEATEYAKEKEKSMRNIVEKNVIPNYVGKIADEYEKSVDT